MLSLQLLEFVHVEDGKNHYQQQRQQKNPTKSTNNYTTKKITKLTLDTKIHISAFVFNMS